MTVETPGGGYHNPKQCPLCAGWLGGPQCGSCGAQLDTQAGRRLFEAGQQADHWITAYAEALGALRREHSAVIAATPGDQTATHPEAIGMALPTLPALSVPGLSADPAHREGAAMAPPVPPPPAAPVSAPVAPEPTPSTWSADTANVPSAPPTAHPPTAHAPTRQPLAAGTVITVVGAALMIGAAGVFLLVNWATLADGARAAILMAITAGFVGLAHFLRAQQLAQSAEAVGVVALGSLAFNAVLGGRLIDVSPGVYAACAATAYVAIAWALSRTLRLAAYGTGFVVSASVAAWALAELVFLKSPASLRLWSTEATMYGGATLSAAAVLSVNSVALERCVPTAPPLRPWRHALGMLASIALVPATISASAPFEAGQPSQWYPISASWVFVALAVAAAGTFAFATPGRLRLVWMGLLAGALFAAICRDLTYRLASVPNSEASWVPNTLISVVGVAAVGLGWLAAARGRSWNHEAPKAGPRRASHPGALGETPAVGGGDAAPTVETRGYRAHEIVTAAMVAMVLTILLQTLAVIPRFGLFMRTWTQDVGGTFADPAAWQPRSGWEHLDVRPAYLWAGAFGVILAAAAAAVLAAVSRRLIQSVASYVAGLAAVAGVVLMIDVAEMPYAVTLLGLVAIAAVSIVGGEALSKRSRSAASGLWSAGSAVLMIAVVASWSHRLWCGPVTVIGLLALFALRRRFYAWVSEAPTAAAVCLAALAAGGAAYRFDATREWVGPIAGAVCTVIAVTCAGGWTVQLRMRRAAAVTAAGVVGFLSLAPLVEHVVYPDTMRAPQLTMLLLAVLCSASAVWGSLGWRWYAVVGTVVLGVSCAAAVTGVGYVWLRPVLTHTVGMAAWPVLVHALAVWAGSIVLLRNQTWWLRWVLLAGAHGGYTVAGALAWINAHADVASTVDVRRASPPEAMWTATLVAAVALWLAALATRRVRRPFGRLPESDNAAAGTPTQTGWGGGDHVHRRPEVIKQSANLYASQLPAAAMALGVMASLLTALSWLVARYQPTVGLDRAGLWLFVVAFAVANVLAAMFVGRLSDGTAWVIGLATGLFACAHLAAGYDVVAGWVTLAVVLLLGVLGSWRKSVVLERMWSAVSPASVSALCGVAAVSLLIGVVLSAARLAPLLHSTDGSQRWSAWHVWGQALLLFAALLGLARLNTVRANERTARGTDLLDGLAWLTLASTPWAVAWPHRSAVLDVTDWWMQVAVGPLLAGLVSCGAVVRQVMYRTGRHVWFMAAATVTVASLAGYVRGRVLPGMSGDAIWAVGALCLMVAGVVLFQRCRASSWWCFAAAFMGLVAPPMFRYGDSGNAMVTITRGAVIVAVAFAALVIGWRLRIQALFVLGAVTLLVYPVVALVFSPGSSAPAWIGLALAGGTLMMLGARSEQQRDTTGGFSAQLRSFR